MKRIGPLISPLIKGLGIEEAVILERIKREWGEIFHEPLSLHMSPSVLKHGELIINVDSSVWLQQLSFLKSEITEKLGSLEVKEVRFRIGKVYAREASAPGMPHPGKTSLSRDVLQQIEQIISEIKDPSVREGARKALERSLTRKTTKF